MDHVLGFRMASIMGLMGMIMATTGDAPSWALAATAITSVTAIVLQILRSRQEDRRYQAEREERLLHQAELKATMMGMMLTQQQQAREMKTNTDISTATLQDTQRLLDVEEGKKN